MDQANDNGQDQQDVDVAAQNVEGKTQDPENQENYS